MKCFNKFYYGMAQVALLATLGLNLVGCAKGSATAGADAAVEASAGDAVSLTKVKNQRKNPHNCKQTSDKCYTETFEQPVTNTQAVDVLFVVQTSDAISPERQAIVAGINSFISSLPAGADFNIAVMLAHGSTSAQSGKLYQAESEPIVLKSSELSNAQIQTYLDAKLNQVVADPDSGGGEEGLFSLFNGITTPALLAASQGQGFFRPEAALGVVFVADRRDICAVVPVGVPAETDPVKIDARIRDCEGLTAAGLTNRLNLLKGALPLAVSGIIYIDQPAPAGNEIGYGYTDMISLNAGVAVDIANDDIEEGLSSIAELSGQQMSIQTEFILNYTGIDAKKVTVTVNGVAATYTLEGNKVTITSPIPAGAVVVISYCLQSKPNTNHCYHRWNKCFKKYYSYFHGDRKHKNNHYHSHH